MNISAGNNDCSIGEKVLVIAGPTGSGKSVVAVKVAEKIGGEIISADSVQIYRHFNIGSAKPGNDQLKRVPHHLIDILEPDEEFAMWDFKIRAQRLIREIAARGRVPILCGGTGLYIKAAVENLDGGPVPDPELRKELGNEMETKGAASMHARLNEVDPAAAAVTHPNDRHRILRALETALSTGKRPEQGKPFCENVFMVLGGPRERLYERINARVDTMLRDGWIEETKSILARGFDDDIKPFQSIGYRQIVRSLNGISADGELAETIKKETRNYAKRQITWFGAVKEAIWVDSVSEPQGKCSPASFIAEYFLDQKDGFSASH